MARKAELVEQYREQFANPYLAAQRGYVDDVVIPSETRPRLINALNMLQNKRDNNPPKKHGNMPLLKLLPQIWLICCGAPLVCPSTKSG